jgi:hypothetical protein
MYMYVAVYVLAQCRSKLAPWVERYDAVTVRTELVDTLKALRAAGADINRYVHAAHCSTLYYGTL